MPAQIGIGTDMNGTEKRAVDRAGFQFEVDIVVSIPQLDFADLVRV
jgi:hypothetical protein